MIIIINIFYDYYHNTNKTSKTVGNQDQWYEIGPKYTPTPLNSYSWYGIGTIEFISVYENNTNYMLCG